MILLTVGLSLNIGTTTPLSVILASVFASAWFVITMVILVVALVAVWDSIEIVEAYEKKALMVFGEYWKPLSPGINFVSPFVSKTYSVDMRTQKLEIQIKR